MPEHEDKCINKETITKNVDVSKRHQSKRHHRRRQQTLSNTFKSFFNFNKKSFFNFNKHSICSNSIYTIILPRHTPISNASSAISSASKAENCAL